MAGPGRRCAPVSAGGRPRSGGGDGEEGPNPSGSRVPSLPEADGTAPGPALDGFADDPTTSPAALDLDDLYDPVTRARLARGDGTGAERLRNVPAQPAVAAAPGWRGGMGGAAFLGAAMLGVRDMLEAPRREPVVEEVDLYARGPGRPRAVTFFYVPGAPRASRVLVRPWLLGEGPAR
ncbi:MAG: hypothetical protein ACT4PW_13405 [Acidimicrobiia bacterium]